MSVRTGVRELFEAGAKSLRPAGNNDESNSTFSVHRFPSNVGEQQIPHYMMFYITKRKTDLTDQEVGTIGRDITADNNVGIRPFMNPVLADLATGVAATIGGFRAGTQLAQGLTESGLGRAAESFVNAVAPGAGTAVKTAAEAGVGAVFAGTAGAGVTGSRAIGGGDKVTLKDCIALYLSGKPSASYSAIWEDKDIGIIAGMGAAAENLMTAGQKLFTGNASGAADSFKAALGGAGSTAAALGLNASAALPGGLGDLGSYVQASQGFAINPFKAQLFKNMGFRTFSFEYVMLPKSASEYQEVQEIIRLFKKYMHPTVDPNNAIFMGYPAEFSMAYYYKENENAELHRIGNCALTNLVVDYGGEDFITFKNSGKPAEISLKLQFTELQLLTDKEFGKGESY